MLQKKLPFVVTLDDLIGLEKDDLRDTGGRNTRLRMAEQAFKKAFAAGIPIVFGSGATSPAIPHGKQANQFAYYAKWGMTPVQAIQTTYLPAARLLNYNWDTQIGSIEKGKFADLLLLRADPLQDIANTQKIEAVVANGRLFDRTALDSLLVGAENAAKNK